MTMVRPSIRWNFAKSRNYVDPRFTFSRTGTAAYVDRHGVQKFAAANTPRWDFDPVTGRVRGMLQEPTRTNLLLHSRALDNVAWTKSEMTVTADQAVAADGTTALELLTATGTASFVTQNITITAGNAITASIYARASASLFIVIVIGDGVDQVTAWFNVARGAVGSSLQTGAGLGTCTFAFADIEDGGGGLYRCSLTVTTATSTLYSAAFHTAGADLATPIAGEAVFAGDVQLESASAIANHASSFIPTTVAAVTRGSDVLSAPLTGPWYNTAEGTMLFDFLVTRRTQTSSSVLGGIGDTFSNTIYLSHSGTSLFLTAISGGAVQVTIGVTPDWTIGARNRVAIAWKLNDFAIVANGGTPATDSAALLPVGPVRMMVGGGPYSASGAATYPDVMCGFAYFPRRLITAELQAVTAPTG